MGILRIKQVLEQTGKSRSGFYSDIERGLMVRPVRIGPRQAGVLSDEVSAIIKARMAGKSDDDIKRLVIELHEARTSL